MNNEKIRKEMNLSVTIAEKLMLLLNGEKIPSSKMKYPLINEMIDNGILKKQVQGRSKALIFLPHPKPLNDYLHNHYGITNLQKYINTLQKKELNRYVAVAVASDSKLRKIRTFKGFLINCYNPIHATLNGKLLILNPLAGTFQFISDYENLTIPEDITVIGVENAENFRYIEKQKYLFENINPLFVSRYPQNQSKDLMMWLKSIPNKYLHFGDFDFEGLNIYLNEYQKHLGEKAGFFVPENIEKLISEYGNQKLYDRQRIHFDIHTVKEEKIVRLIAMIHKYKKGLEQEIFVLHYKN